MSEIFTLSRSSAWSESDFKGVVAKKAFFWVDLHSPSPADVKILERYLKIHPLTSDDIINKKNPIKN